jgi:hypothetical protein
MPNAALAGLPGLAVLGNFADAYALEVARNKRLFRGKSSSGAGIPAAGNIGLARTPQWGRPVSNN